MYTYICMYTLNSYNTVYKYKIDIWSVYVLDILTSWSFMRQCLIKISLLSHKCCLRSQSLLHLLPPCQELHCLPETIKRVREPHCYTGGRAPSTQRTHTHTHTHTHCSLFRVNPTHMHCPAARQIPKCILINSWIISTAKTRFICLWKVC